MKKMLFLILNIAFLAACKKDAVVTSSNPAPKIMLAGAVVVSKGELVFSSGSETSGLAKIYKQTVIMYWV